MRRKSPRWREMRRWQIKNKKVSIGEMVGGWWPRGGGGNRQGGEKCEVFRSHFKCGGGDGGNRQSGIGSGDRGFCILLLKLFKRLKSNSLYR